jgi:hypothetical protein
MSLCPNCDLPLTAAPWRYDDSEHGLHWVCPTEDAVDPEFIYAPISLAEALDDYLRHLPRQRVRV